MNIKIYLDNITYTNKNDLIVFLRHKMSDHNIDVDDKNITISFYSKTNDLTSSDFCSIAKEIINNFQNYNPTSTLIKFCEPPKVLINETDILFLGGK